VTDRPVTLLCLASYVKGHEFLREAKRLGCRVILITPVKHRDAPWPRESLDEHLLMPDLKGRDDVVNGISYLARSERIDRIVPLDEFDLEMAASVREHMRAPGMGESVTRHFRDKLAMRVRAAQQGVRVPEFVGLFDRGAVARFLDAVPPPWILKPRFSASAIGIRKVGSPDEVWGTLDALGDQQSYHLLERFVRGDVLHVDSVVWEGEVRFAEASEYVTPPFEVYHGGGLFATRVVERGTAHYDALLASNRRIAEALGMERGVLHTELIHGAEDGGIYFLETAARVGGAHIVEMLEAATGVNLWREWARVEAAAARGAAYEVTPLRHDYAALLVSLARQERPDLSAYDAPEIAWRMDKEHHAGLILASPRRERVRELLGEYMRRFREDFYASMPAATEAHD
jgi:biotin carboxylase